MASNVAALFFDRARVSADREAFRYLVGDRWRSVTWEHTAGQVRKLAAGLLALGVESDQRVAIVSSTRYEWVLGDLAVMCAGGVTTTVYPTTNGDDTAYILADSESRIVFAENQTQLDKLTAHRADLPAVTKVVTFDGPAEGDWVITLDDLAELGAQHLRTEPRCVAAAVDAIEPDRLATLIYTSGTTGSPKGVRLIHRAWVYQGGAVAALGILDERDVQLLWLPLAHAFGKVLIMAQLACGFATAIDGRVDKVIDNMAVVQPSFMAAAPRIFEKAHARVVTAMRARGGLPARTFDAAFAVGLQVSRRRRAGLAVPLRMRLAHRLFDRLVFRKVRETFGGRSRFLVSGSAPLSPDIAEWFHAAGLLIVEGYGLTETAGAAFINHPQRFRLGTVGLAFEGTSVRIGDDGEVQLRGPNVMAGYHGLPEATAAALTDDGWLKTGDIGTVDADGFLTITGRIKELFKTSGGKYIAPPAIEAKFIALCPYVSHFLVFGESRNFCVALVALDRDAITGWAANNGLDSAPYAELVRTPAVHNLIDEHVGKLNAQLNRWETVKKWALLEHDLSVERGELTPSLKVKRAVVADRNRETLDAFYS